MSQRVDIRRVQAEVAQLVLWEPSGNNRTNMVALYDLAPKWVLERRERSEIGVRREPIKREFSFGKKRYRITMKPTQIEEAGGTADRFLGEREAIVEEVIRRLACRQGRLTLLGDNKIRFTFTVYEVMQELARVGHSLSREEVVEAITLLNEVRLRIESLDGPRQPLLSAPAFPVIAMRKGGENSDETDTYVEFNPLVAEAIRTLDFHEVSYELLMSINDAVARWLVKKLQMEISVLGETTCVMLATEIRLNSGMSKWKTERNMLRRVTSAVDLLVSKGVLTHVEKRQVREGQRMVDVEYIMVASPEFVAQARRSMDNKQGKIAAYGQVTHGRDTSQFVEIPIGDACRLRNRIGDRRKAA